MPHAAINRQNIVTRRESMESPFQASHVSRLVTDIDCIHPIFTWRPKATYTEPRLRTLQTKYVVYALDLPV